MYSRILLIVLQATLAITRTYITEEIETLRTKLTDASENETVSSERSLNVLEELPDLESPQTFSRDSSVETSERWQAAILGTVQVADTVLTPSKYCTPLFLQTKQILSTWSIILGKLQKVGVLCIADVFELHPFVKDHFLGLLVKYNQVTS